MAATIYGYRIERGKAVPDKEALGRIMVFMDKYLSGLSVIEANRIAGIPLSRRGIIHLMNNKTYLGTDYYPPLTTEQYFNTVQREYRKRTHGGTSTPALPVPVQTSFTLAPLPSDKPHGSAAEVAVALYGMIVPTENDRTRTGSTDIVAFRNWASEQDEYEERSGKWR